jgi:hypothetical protein
VQFALYLRHFCYFTRELGLDATSIVALASSFLTIAGVVIGAKWQYSKSKAYQLTHLLELILEAAKGDKVTEGGFRGIVSATKFLRSRDPRISQ